MTLKSNIVKTWRDSAALLLIARQANSHGKYKILMLKRTPKSKFMPSAYVFPGGVSSATDFSQEWTNILRSEMEMFNERLKIIDDQSKQLYLYSSNADKPLRADVAFRLCSIRETFEESGILLTRDETGCQYTLTNPNHNIGGEYATLGGWRDKVNENPAAFLKLFHEVNHLRPDVCSLYEWSCALTPTFMKQRFDTLFHMCFLDHEPDSVEDGGEVVDSLWDSPQQLLTNHGHELPPPQQIELQRLATYDTYEKLRTFAVERELLGLELSCPYMVKLKDGNLKTLPGDDLYNDDPSAKLVTYDHLTVEDAFRQSRNVNRAEILTEGDVSRIRCNVTWRGHPPLGDVSTKVWRGEAPKTSSKTSKL